MTDTSLLHKYPKGGMALKILALVVVGSAVMAVAIIPGLPQIARMFGAKTSRERYRIQQSLHQLEKRGYIKRRKYKKEDAYALTSAGRIYVETVMLEKQTIPQSPTWDGVWRVLMFDIPEELGVTRREASMLIREMGMMKIQNSVFASPYPCEREIQKIARHYNIGEYFVYLETKKISCEERLKSYFKLS
jgi:DNA-binding transcriptional regulator PaaX